MRHYNRQHGLSLIELMIAITLGLLIVGSVIQLLLTSKSTFRTVDSVSNIQDSARYSMHLLNKELRMAGYTGCITRGTSVDVTNTLNSSNTALYDFSAGLKGYNDVSGTPSDLATAMLNDPAPIAGTDVLLIRGPLDSPLEVTQSNNSAQVFTTAGDTETAACDDGTDRIGGLCIGDILMVSDCAKARVFQLTNITVTGGTEANLVHSSSGASPGNALSSWGGASAPEEEQFDTDAEVVRISTLVYYVATASDSGLPALYRKEGSGPAVVIADGIQDFQLEYGEDTDDDFEAETYTTANSVTDWEAVRSIKIKMLLISQQDNVINENQQYSFNNVDSTATNRRLHYSLTSTVTLRNRVP